MRRATGTMLSWLVALTLTSTEPRDLPVLVGGHAHGAETIRALKELGLGNFVWIPKKGYPMGNVPWNEEHDIHADVAACVRQGLFFMVSQRRGLGRDFKPGGGEFGGDTTPDIYPSAEVRRMRAAAGRLMVGLHAEELDVDFLQNALRPGWRTRTPELYDFTDRRGGRRCFERELRRLSRSAREAGARFLPNLAVTYQHSGFRAGGDIVLGELLEALPCVELQLAYLRGGARQFGKRWGVWVSPWHRGKVPTEDPQLWRSPNAAVGGGHPASYFKRCLYLAWGSGASLLTMQETEPLFSRASGGGYRLAAWGRELKAFWDFLTAHGFDRKPVQPLVPLAFLIDADNGWAPGHLHGDWIEHETVWAKLRPDRGDLMLRRYLDAFLPGFHRTKGWWQHEGGEYPGYFASTPFGPVDVVASDIRPERLSAYPTVVVMGEVSMTPSLLQRLRKYVQNGGRLILNTNQFRHRERFVQDAEFLGATVGQSRQWSNWSRSMLLMRRTVSSNKIVLKEPLPGLAAGEYDEPWYAAQDVQPTTAKVIAMTGTGEPLLLRHTFGKGEVWLTTPDYLMSDASLSGERMIFFTRWFGALASTTGVRVSSPDGGSVPDVSWVASRHDGRFIVVVANHGRVPRDVRVTLPHGQIRQTTVPGEDIGVIFRGSDPSD